MHQQLDAVRATGAAATPEPREPAEPAAAAPPSSAADAGADARPSTGARPGAASLLSPVVVVATSLELVSLTGNMLCTLRPFVRPEHRVLVFALDAGVCAQLAGVLVSFPPGTARCDASHAPRAPPGGGASSSDGGLGRLDRNVMYKSLPYRRHTVAKLRAQAALMADPSRPEGQWYLFADTDVVFLRSPFGYVRRVRPAASFVFQQSGEHRAVCADQDAMGNPRHEWRYGALGVSNQWADITDVVCTGLYFIRADAAARAVIAAALRRDALKGGFDGLDQGAVNYALKATDSPFHLLPCAEWPNGSAQKALKLLVGGTGRRRHGGVRGGGGGGGGGGSAGRSAGWPAYAIHYNWRVSAAAKIHDIRAAGMWLYHEGAGVTGAGAGPRAGAEGTCAQSDVQELPAGAGAL